MAVLRIDGGWYADARPDGAYAVLIPDLRIDTHRGPLSLPPGGNLLYLRIAPDGIRIAGAGHHDDRVWEWTGSEWVDRGIAYGVSPVIYDNHGTLQINDGSWGSQGARWMTSNNVVVTADDTYFRSDWELSEWSSIGPIYVVGQSHPDGTNDAGWIYDILRRTHYLLEPGPCRFIRAHRDGDRVSIAIWKPGQGAVIHWLTLDEIRALPVVNPSPSTPHPAPTPEPVPVAEIDIVRRIRAKYPLNNPGDFPLGDEGWMPIVEVAQAFQAQVYRKEGGERVYIPALKKSCNRTIIGRGPILGNRWVKVFADGEGTAAPIWSWGDTPADGEYIDVSGVVIPGAPVPQPTPQPQPELTLEQRVERIEQWIRRTL